MPDWETAVFSPFMPHDAMHYDTTDDFQHTSMVGYTTGQHTELSSTYNNATF